MDGGNFPATIPGFSLFEPEFRHLGRWEFQATADFTENSVRQLFEELPAGFEIVFDDPDEKDEGCLFFRKSDQNQTTFFVMKRKHGSSGNWKTCELKSAVSAFIANYLKQKSLDSMELFTILSVGSEKVVTLGVYDRPH